MHACVCVCVRVCDVVRGSNRAKAKENDISMSLPFQSSSLFDHPHLANNFLSSSFSHSDSH